MKDETRILEEIGLAVEGTGSRQSRLGRVAGIIRWAGGYRWVGIYDVANGEISSSPGTARERDEPRRGLQRRRLATARLRLGPREPRPLHGARALLRRDGFDREAAEW